MKPEKHLSIKQRRIYILIVFIVSVVSVVSFIWWHINQSNIFLYVMLLFTGVSLLLDRLIFKDILSFLKKDEKELDERELLAVLQATKKAYNILRWTILITPIVVILLSVVFEQLDCALVGVICVFIFLFAYYLPKLILLWKEKEI